jgi:hypothetical protein
MMTAEHKEYLDKLRDSGITNMYFATDYLINKFRITYEEAKAILKEWMALHK